jgi:hypothetical protein
MEGGNYLIDVTTTRTQHASNTSSSMIAATKQKTVLLLPFVVLSFPKSGGDTVESNMVVKKTSQILIGMESGLGKRSATDQSKEEALFGR